jgi:hypothetical protein
MFLDQKLGMKDRRNGRARRDQSTLRRAARVSRLQSTRTSGVGGRKERGLRREVEDEPSKERRTGRLGGRPPLGWRRVGRGPLPVAAKRRGVGGRAPWRQPVRGRSALNVQISDHLLEPPEQGLTGVVCESPCSLANASARRFFGVPDCWPPLLVALAHDAATAHTVHSPS